MRISGVALASSDFAAFANPSPPPDPGADTSGDGIPDVWAIAHGLDPAENNALGDTNGDGIPHLLEFALALDEVAPQIAGLPLVEPKDDHLVLTATRAIPMRPISFLSSRSVKIWRPGIPERSR